MTLIAKTLVSVVGLVAGLVASSVAGAVEQWHASTLQWVYPLANGDFVIGFDVDSPACLGTNSPKYMYVVVGQNGVTLEGTNKLYAAALTAFALGKTVSISFDDASPGCYVNRLTINK